MFRSPAVSCRAAGNLQAGAGADGAFAHRNDHCHTVMIVVIQPEHRLHRLPANYLLFRLLSYYVFILVVHWLHAASALIHIQRAVSYTHLTLPTKVNV